MNGYGEPIVSQAEALRIFEETVMLIELARQLLDNGENRGAVKAVLLATGLLDDGMTDAAIEMAQSMRGEAWRG